MSNDKTMKEIHKIKSELSKKYAKMTTEEIKEEGNKALERFLSAIGKNKS